MNIGDSDVINKAYIVIAVPCLKASSQWKCWEIHFPLRQSPGITAVHKQHDKLFSPWSQRMEKSFYLSPGISQMCSWSCLDLVLSHILHWGKTQRSSESHRFTNSWFLNLTCQFPSSSSSSSASSDSVQLHSCCSHSMSVFFRLSSSSDTVRFPRYQNIQKIRLRKISRGPDSTKKSQKVKGAKIPTNKRTRPATSIITASDRKKMVDLLCSMAGPGETDRWMSSEGLTGTSLSRKVLSGLLNHHFFTRSTPYISFIAQDLVAGLVSNHNNGLCR